MDTSPRFEVLSEHRYSVAAVEDDQEVAIIVEITPEVLEWIEGHGFEEGAVVEAAIGYLTERQRVDELPTKLFLEDVDAAYDDFRATITSRLKQAKAHTPIQA